MVAGGHAQIDEVRSGGSYISQSDLRLHFGMGPARPGLEGRPGRGPLAERPRGYAQRRGDQPDNLG